MFVRVCSGYTELISALRDRKVEMQISGDAIDTIAGLSDRHTSKLLAPRFTKILGPVTLGPMLETLGLRLMLVEDTAATARTIEKREPVKATHQRFGNRNIANATAAAKIAATEADPAYASVPTSSAPAVSRAHLRVVQTRRGGIKF